MDLADARLEEALALLGRLVLRVLAQVAVLPRLQDLLGKVDLQLVVQDADLFFEHPRFIEAIAARLSEALARLPAGRRASAPVVFTAHSIPSEMQGASRYAETIRRTAELAGGASGIASWSIAYQSRSGRPADHWLEPDIGESIRILARRGARDVVVAPIGFVSDHVEVLYDLDIAARAVADEMGVGFVRAGTVGDHPAFVRMLADLVRGVAARRSA